MAEAGPHTKPAPSICGVRPSTVERPWGGRALEWMQMRVEHGQVFSLDTMQQHSVGEDLLNDRGDVAIVAHDLLASLRACSDSVAASLGAGRVPIVVGGDDSLLFAAVRGFHDAIDGMVGVVHFDAHLDLMDENVQQGRYSHSSGMRRSLELDRVSAGHSIQVGVRHFNFPSSQTFIEESGLAELSAIEFHRIGAEAAVERIAERVSGADHVFWSFDVDVIDPAYAPGAGAHEPGGLTSRQALDCVRLLAPHCDGFAVMEVNPMLDVGDATSTLAAYLIYSFAVYGRARAG
ncbi:MAG: arginase family protein [Acidimicrobiia bacterium]